MFPVRRTLPAAVLRRAPSAGPRRRAQPHGAWLPACLAACLAAGPSTAGWQTYTSADGLGRDGVNAALVDARDHLWFGTNDGLSHFDGVHWETYRQADGLPTSVVKALAEDLAGRVWVGTTARPGDGSALAMIDGGRVRRFLPEEGLPRGVEARLLLTAPDGAVWVVHSGNRGVSRFQDGAWTRFTTELADSTVHTTLVARDGSIWFGTGRGLARYDGAWTSHADPGVRDVTHLAEDTAGGLWVGSSEMGTLHRFDGSRFEEQPVSSIQGLLAAGDGSVWVASPGRLRRRVAGAFSDFPLPAGWTGSVETLFEDRDGRIWVTGAGEGAARHDGDSWAAFDETGDLVSDTVPIITQDRAGNLWFAACCSFSGVSRFDGERWVTLRTGATAAGNSVKSLLADADGTLWVGTNGGLRRVRAGVVEQPAAALEGRRVRALLRDASGVLRAGTDGGAWRLSGGAWELDLPDADVWALCQDRSGVFWFGTARGQASEVIRRDGAALDTLEVDGNVRDIISDSSGRIWVATVFGDGVLRWQDGRLLPVPGDSDAAYRLHEDAGGVLWAATDAGIERLEGDRFVLLDSPSWLLTATLSIAEDAAGRLWFGTNEGLVRFDGADWVSFSDADGVRGGSVAAALADPRDGLWFGTADGLVRHETDGVAPRAVLTANPPRLSTASEQTFPVVAAFGETGAEFSYALADSQGMDAPPWSSWSTRGSWTRLLPDGHHVFLVRARDRLGNVQAPPTAAGFEIDATPPAPLLTAPGYGQVVSGTVRAEGTAADPRFRDYAVAVGSGAGWELLAAADSAVVNGLLALWNTTLAADGEYTIRLQVSDTLGVVGSDSVRVVVDNLPPHAGETSPVRILAGEGGHVFTTDGAVHLYFPPFAFDEDAVVEIDDASGFPGPETGTLLRAFTLAWGAQLTKAVTLAVDLGRDIRETDPDCRLFVQPLGATGWQSLGGTLSPDGNQVSATLRHPGTYAVVVGGAPPAGDSGLLSGLTLTPRTLSPRGQLGNREIAVGFALGRPSEVTVRVYSRTGRLVRDLVRFEPLPAGENLVRWDGRDREGKAVASGLYLVTVETEGRSETASLAVVR